MHQKEAEDRLAEVLTAHRDTPPRSAEPSPDGVTSLLPGLPLSREPIYEALEEMRSALDGLDLLTFGRVWQGLMEAKAYTALTDENWVALNRRLAAGLRGSKAQRFQGQLHGRVPALVHDHPTLFQSVCHFAVEAAARHHWQSLLEIFFELLRFDHAAIAKTLFEAYTARGIVVEGIDRSLATSQVRAERVASRFKSPGLRPLLLTYVAALTVLDKFDHTTIPTLIPIHPDIWQGHIRRHDMWLVSQRIWWPLLKEWSLLERYEANCDNMLLIYYSLHPAAFGIHINALSAHTPGDSSALDEMYDRVMKASIGPDRLLVPTVEVPRSLTIAPLPLGTWSAFAAGYATLGRPDAIIRMIEEELPARYGTVPIDIYEFGMGHLSHTASIMPDLAPRLQLYLDTLWERMLAMGAGRSPLMVRGRLMALMRMNQIDQFQATASALHKGLLDAGDPRANIAVVPQLISYHLRERRYFDALSLLQRLDRIEGDDRFAFAAARDLMRNVCFTPYSYAKRRKLVSEAMRRISPSLLKDASCAGPLLRFLLEGGNSVEAACAMLVQKDKKVAYYLYLLQRLTVRSPERGQSFLGDCIEAAVHILETYVPRHTFISGVGYTNMWNCVIKGICKSSLPEHERAALVHRTMACFPDTSETDDRHLAPLLRSIVSDSLARPDPFPELAQHWWRELYDSDQGMSYRGEIHAAVRGFTQANLPQVAIQVVEMACRMSTRHASLRPVLYGRAEWTTGEFEDALFEAGVTNADGEVVERLPRFGVDYGLSSWDEEDNKDDGWNDNIDSSRDGDPDSLDAEAAEAAEMDTDEMGAGEELEDVD